MKIVVNSREVETQVSTLYALLAELNIQTVGAAVALNRRVVPRSQWSETQLSEDDNVMVVSAVYGG